jgi:small conductance mechanosensitive channel
MDGGALSGQVTSLEDLLARLQSWVVTHAPNGLRILLILGAAFIVTRVLRRLILRVERMLEDEDPTATSEREKRARTLGRILRQAVVVVVWGVTTATILGELGLDLKPILAGAGIAGLAFGFGAQTLVKDLIAGFFILLENQFRVNDVIQAAGVSGLVESINLRTTVLRDVEGRLHVIPNGEIGVVTNFTHEWSRAVLDVGVAYKEDTDRCVAVLRRVGAEMEGDAEFGPKLAGPFEYPGVESFGDSAVVLRMLVKTQPQERWNVLRELRRRVKKAFDEHGIEIPFPHVTLYLGEAPSRGSLRVEVDASRMAASGALAPEGRR